MARCGHFHRTLKATTVSSKLEQHCLSQVLSLDGELVYDVGFVFAHHPASPLVVPLHMLPAEVKGVALDTKTYLGLGDPTERLAKGDCIVLLSMVLPLPAGHGIPVGQFWDAEIGSRDFIASLQEMAAGSDPSEIHARLHWVADSSCMQDWLDAVTKYPNRFTIPLLAHASVADSLCPPADADAAMSASLVSSDSLAPITYMSFTTACRLHRDTVRSSLKTSHSEEHAQYELRAAANFACPDDEPSFGYPDVHANAALWVLHPPMTKTAIKTFGMASFLDAAVCPPQFADFQPVAIPTCKNLPATYAVVPLETRAEFCAAIKDVTPDSPSKVLQQKRIALALKAQTSASQTMGQQQQQQAPPLQGGVAQGLFGSFGSGLGSFMTPVDQRTQGPPLVSDAATVRTNHLSSQGLASQGSTTLHPPHGLSTSTSQGFGFASGVSQQLALDPLAQCLNAAHSTPWQPAPVPAPAPVMTDPPVGTNPFLAHQYQVQPQMLFHPFSYQLVDESGRNVHPRLDTLWMKKDLTTWLLDSTQRKSPPNMIFLLSYLASSGPPAQGVLTATNEPIPASWTLRPTDITLPFCTHFLLHDATGAKAKVYLWSNAQRVMGPGPVLFTQPTSMFGSSFFQDDTFKKFRDCSPWLCLQVEMEEDIKENFTALHWLRIHPHAGSHFASAGETCEHCETALINIKHLFSVASAPDPMLAMACGHQSHATPLIVLGIDCMLQALQGPKLRTDWNGPCRQHTVLFYDVWESLHLVFVRRNVAFHSTPAAFAKVTPASSGDTPLASILLMNPAMSQQCGAPLVIQELEKWQQQELPCLADATR